VLELGEGLVSVLQPDKLLLSLKQLEEREPFSRPDRI
jgi:hypothetical protein